MREKAASLANSPVYDVGGVDTLVVGPKRACAMLGIGTTRLYALLAASELDSYLEGSGRRITTASIVAYVQRRLTGAPPPRQNPRKPPIRQREPSAPIPIGPT
jgi:hypothetical protein